MAISFKKTYKFAVKSAFYITFFSMVFLTLLLYYFNQVNYILITVFTISIYLFSFFIVQYRVERFIYRRVKKIYDDVSLLDS